MISTWLRAGLKDTYLFKGGNLVSGVVQLTLGLCANAVPATGAARSVEGEVAETGLHT